MIFQSSSNYLIYYSITTDLQSVGIKKKNIAGILIGTTQVMVYMIISPISYKLPRRLTTLFLQSINLVAVLGLAVLSFTPSSVGIDLIRVGLSAGVVNSMISGLYPFLYIYTLELFPAEICGFTVSMVIFFGRIVGSFAPEIKSVTVN